MNFHLKLGFRLKLQKNNVLKPRSGLKGGDGHTAGISTMSVAASFKVVDVEAEKTEAAIVERSFNAAIADATGMTLVEANRFFNLARGTPAPDVFAVGTRDRKFPHRKSGIAIPFLVRTGDKWTFVDATCNIGDWIDAGAFGADAVLTYEPPKHTDKYPAAQKCVDAAASVRYRAGDVRDKMLSQWYSSEENRVYGAILIRPPAYTLKSIYVDGSRMDHHLARHGIRLPVTVRRSRSISPTAAASEVAAALRKRLFNAIRRQPCESVTWSATSQDQTLLAAVLDAELVAKPERAERKPRAEL